MTVKFEGQDRRQAKIDKVLAEYGLKSLEEAREICLEKNIDVDAIVKVFNLLHLKMQVGHTLWAQQLQLKKEQKMRQI